MSVPYIGEIRMLPFNFAPRGWMACNGSLLPISQYDALFALIGTTYGGDGVNTFALPDLRGRVPVHQGQGPGLTARFMGERAGTEVVALSAGQMPAHSHTLSVTSAAATLVTPDSNSLPGTVSGDTFYVNSTSGNTMAPMSAQMIAPGGGSQPHQNTMPTLTVQYCMAVEGVFPSRN